MSPAPQTKTDEIHNRLVHILSTAYKGLPGIYAQEVKDMLPYFDRLQKKSLRISKTLCFHKKPPIDLNKPPKINSKEQNLIPLFPFHWIDHTQGH